MSGRFIALEGGEGAGKTTQARLLAGWLEARGLSVVATREPGGTPGAEAIRRLLLDPPEGEGWTIEAEALLFAAARAEHVARIIRPALAAGQWVVCDRFVGSSIAYQGGAGGLGEAAIGALHQFGSHGLMPDLTILLEADEARIAARLAQRDGGRADAIGGRSADYHRAVARHFRRMAEADPDGTAILAADGAPEAVHAQIRALVAPLLGAAPA